MAETTREASNAAEITDDVAMICHTLGVRVPCNEVKLESVRAICDVHDMADTETMGGKFRALVTRSGVSYRDLAAAAKFSAASGIQRYVDVHNDKPMGVDVAKRFAAALTGKGLPPISADEVMALTGMTASPPSNAKPIHFEGASFDRLKDDLPVYGTALGAEVLVDGAAIEQTMLNSGDVVEYRKRPIVANGMEKLYGLYVQGSSMYPAHRDGALLFCQWGAPLRVDDDVVVYLRPKDDSDDGDRAACVLVKRLVKRTSQYVELEQFNPAKVFRIGMADVLKIDRVLTTDDYA